MAHLFSRLCTNNRNSRERVGPREDSIEIQGPENIPGGSRLATTLISTGGKEDNLDIIQIYQILQINRRQTLTISNKEMGRREAVLLLNINKNKFLFLGVQTG